MIDYLIGVDGGGTGTRVRIARADGTELATGRSGPSALVRGIPAAWAAIEEAAAQAFAAAAIARPPRSAMAIGLGLAGVNHGPWASAFAAANPGYAALALETDGFTTLLGAHGGGPGAVIAIGTGSVGVALSAEGLRREVGGWGFPSGDEGSGGWIGLRAINHVQQVLDGRQPSGDFARAVVDACGGSRERVFAWVVQADQTRYAALAPLAFVHADTDTVARGLLAEASRQIGAIARALDPARELPVALCGGLGVPLRPYLPPDLMQRAVEPRTDSTTGALCLIQRHVANEAMR